MGPFLGVARVLFIYLLVSAAVAKNACTEPSVRVEWRKLAPSERDGWINAVNCLAALPHDPKLAPSVPANKSQIPPVNPNSSFYDDIVYAHMDLNLLIHTTGLFLPWHRRYVQYFEDVLKEKCGYNGSTPYWDWTQGTVGALTYPDAHYFYNSDFFNDSSSSVGGWGDPDNDYQISTGGFKNLTLAYPSPHRIRRNFTLFPFANPVGLPSVPSALLPPGDLMINTTMTKEKVDSLVSGYEGDFMGFQTDLDSGSHAGVHLIVGGDMSGTCPNNTVPPACYPGAKWTPNDPIFFLHHAMVDKIWSDWQNKSAKNKYSYGGGSVAVSPDSPDFQEFPTGRPPYTNFDSRIPSDGLWDGNVTVWDMMDTTGDSLCYVYA